MARLQTIPVARIIDAIPIDAGEQFRLQLNNLTVPQSDGTHVSITITPITNAIFARALMYDYHDWQYYAYGDISPIDALSAHWASFTAKYYTQIARIAIALLADYDPTHNYNRYEQTSQQTLYGDRQSTRTIDTANTRGYDDLTDTRATTDRRTANTTDVTTTRINQSAITQRTTYDDNSSTGAWRNDARTYTATGNVAMPDGTISDGNNTTTHGIVDDQHTVSDTHTTTGGYTDASSGTITDSTNVLSPDTATTDNHMYGNIGVTTTTDMLTAEIDYRLSRNLTDTIMRLFADNYLILLP